MDFSQVAKIGLSVLGVIFFVSYVIGVIRLMLYERNINTLHEESEKEIAALEESKRPVDQSARQQIDWRISLMKESYDKRIETLERKRRFLLEKLPFFKK